MEPVVRERISLWPSCPALETSTLVAAVTGIQKGGGRGYVAMKDIPAGTCVLAEHPLMTWPEDTNDLPLHVAVVKGILAMKKKRDAVLQLLKDVHPTSLSIVPPELVVVLKEKYSEYIPDLLVSFPDGEDELLRLFFVLQMSAFGSGIYLHFSLFNHLCYPNCIKFKPIDDDSSASRVYTTRLIKAGEELTLSYLQPPEQTKKRRKELLSSQFGFEPSNNPKDDMLEKLKDPQREDAVGEVYILEDRVEELDRQMAKDYETTGEYPDTLLSQLLELSRELSLLVDPRHVVLLRLNKMILRVLHPQLEKDKGDKGSSLGKNLVLYLETAYEIYKTQLLCIPLDHIDFATTFGDLSLGLESLLGWEPELLFSSFSQWNSFEKASKFQYFCQKSVEKLDKMYS